MGIQTAFDTVVCLTPILLEQGASERAVAMEALKAELAALTELERADLAHFLLTSLHDATAADANVEVEEAWATELARRAGDIQRGTVVGKPADQILRNKPRTEGNEGHEG